MIVTNGAKVYDTDNMIVIDERENFSNWSVFEKILFSKTDGEYFYFCIKNYNKPDNIGFRKTQADSLAELDEREMDEFSLQDELFDFDLDEEVSYTELAIELMDQLEDEFSDEDYDFQPIYEIAQQFDNENNMEAVEFLENENNILKQYNINPLQAIERLDDVVSSIDAKQSDLIFDVNQFQKQIIFEIRVAENGFYLLHKEEHEKLTYTFVNELPIELVLKYCSSKQRFEDLTYLLKYITQDYRDESVGDRKYNYLYDNELTMIWGVTRQNFSKTYSNPIESKKRVRKRQKMIIELGSTALNYGISEKELLNFAKSLEN